MIDEVIINMLIYLDIYEKLIYLFWCLFDVVK